MIKIYCDTGGYRPELKRMQKNGLISIVQFHYENRNRNIRESAPPSDPSWDEVNYSWDELDDLTWDDIGKKSDKYGQIVQLIGRNNAKDIKHLDSAYRAGCEAFITSDKGDISSKKEKIYSLLGIHVL